MSDQPSKDTKETRLVREEQAPAHAETTGSDPMPPGASAPKISLARLHESLAQAKLLAVSVNRQGVITFCNPAFGQLLEEPPARLLGRNLFEEVLLSPGQSLSKAQLGSDTFEEELIRYPELQLQTRSGKVVMVTVVSRLLHQDDAAGGLTLMAENRSERAMIQQKLTESNLRYNTITNHTLQSTNLDDLYYNIHQDLKKEVQAEDFAIARWHPDQIEFSYWEGPVGQQFGEPEQRQGYQDLVNYTVTVSKPLLLEADDLKELTASGVIRPLPIVPGAWIGIPLISGHQAIGVLFVQHRKQGFLNSRDLELLDFVSGQLALAVARKSDEEKLAEQQSRQYAIFESSTHLVWSVNRQLQLTAFNRNFEKTMRAQYSVNPQVGAQYNPDHPTVTQRYLNDWKEKYQEAFRGKIVQFETRLSRDDQPDLWKMVFINPIYRPDGAIHEVAGIAHDVTQRKKSESALLTSEAKFRNIFESFQDIYFRCRPDGTITIISPSVKELTGYETYEVLGKNVTNYYLYDKRTKNLIRELVKQKSVRNFEATIISSAGDLIQCICNVRLVDSLNGRDREIEGVARDITNLKKATLALQKAKDEAERALKVKEAFLANMSHEIRTPMNGLMNMVDLLDDTPLNAQQRDYLQTVQDSSKTLLTIVNDILDLSKIEAGKMTLQAKPTRLSALVDHLLNLFSRQAEEKNVTVSQQIDPAVPPVLVVDEIRLLQVLSNLLSNAIKFTEVNGSVHIRITEDRVVPDNKATDVRDEHLIRVMVSDTGIGISAENQKTLFKKFSQVDTSATKRYAGTGLGLSISRQLVKLMGGDIGADSVPEQGSTFWFTFRAAAAEAVLPLAQQEKLAFAEAGPQVLVVDDNQINRRVAYEILRNAGCTVTTAESGEAAVMLVEKQFFDIILMDIQMPGMSGIQATRQIKSLGLALQPPVVAMTAYSLPGDQERFIAAGLDDYLSKPIRPEEMLPKIATLTGFKLQQRPTPASAPTETAFAPIIDETVLGKLAKYGGKELVTASLRDFEEEAHELVREVDQAYQKQDYTAMQRSLHTLKGNAGTLGIQRVAKQATNAEMKLKQKKYAELSEDLLLLRDSFLEFRQTFHTTYNPQSYA